MSEAAVPDAGTYNVRDFGATGDGHTLDTAALNRCIAAAHAAGGGTVTVPAGRYLSGTIRLRSRVALHLGPGATIVGTKDLAAYTTPGRLCERFKAVHTLRWYQALILAEDEEDVAIWGPGTIDGGKVFDPEGEERMRGPHAVYFQRCSNVRIRDVQVVDASNYAILITESRDVDIQGVTVRGGWDAVHMWDTRGITVANGRFYSGDDCIAGAYWANATISGCVLNTSCNAFRMGGRNVAISHCVIHGPGVHPHRTQDRHNTLSGFHFWPGWECIENWSISGIVMDQVQAMLTWRMQKEGGVIRNVLIDHVTVTGAKAPVMIAAMPSAPARDISLSHVRIEYTGGATPPREGPYGFDFENLRNVELHDVTVTPTGGVAGTPIRCRNVGALELVHFEAGAGGPPVSGDVGRLRVWPPPGEDGAP